MGAWHSDQWETQEEGGGLVENSPTTSPRVDSEFYSFFASLQKNAVLSGLFPGFLRKVVRQAGMHHRVVLIIPP